MKKFSFDPYKVAIQPKDETKTLDESPVGNDRPIDAASAEEAKAIPPDPATDPDLLEYDAMLQEVSKWPSTLKRRYENLARAYQNPDRGFGIHAQALSPMAAARKAFHEIKNYCLAEKPQSNPIPQDPAIQRAVAELQSEFPNTSSAIREILLKTWITWDSSAKARFKKSVKITTKHLLSEGSAVCHELSTIRSANLKQHNKT